MLYHREDVFPLIADQLGGCLVLMVWLDVLGCLSLSADVPTTVEDLPL